MVLIIRLILCKYTKFQSRLQVFSKILFYLHTSEHHLHIGKRTVKQVVTAPVQMFTFFQKKSFVNKLACSSIEPHASSFYVSDSYFSSSKSTIIHYQCVSTGCCVHVARIKISIDNQHVTKSLQKYRFLPKQPKENTEKSQTCHIFVILVGHRLQKCQKIVVTKTLPILTTFSREACLGRIKYLPLLALFYSKYSTSHLIDNDSTLTIFCRKASNT